ncbi:MAG: phosphatidylserine decarboxylase family protein [Schleiferiaceae bacterium]
MKLHREGRASLLLGMVFMLIIYLLTEFAIENVIVNSILWGVAIFLLLFLMWFFRVPSRKLTFADDQVIAPADGKVVVIEEVEDPEFFKGKRLQVSIFMSPLNVHVNRFPIPGKVTYAKYHPGAFLVAWHPKSSTLNERTTVVVENEKGAVMYRQIAGALARRIVMYAKAGQTVNQNQESGFIKFGSRVDLLLPLDAEVHVKVGDKPQGGVTRIATLR